jgi:hypothetical protein
VVIGRYHTFSILGRAAMALAIAALASLPLAKAEPAAKAEQQAPKPAQIDRNGVLMLVRSTLLALDQANKTGNYTVLRDLGAPGFQVNTAARLAEIFAKQRNDNLDLSGVAVIDPQLSLLPQIEPNGLMRMAGFFPSVPSQVNFELVFAPVNGQWRLVRHLGFGRPGRPGCAVRAATATGTARCRPAQSQGAAGADPAAETVTIHASTRRAEIDEGHVRDPLLHLGGHDELCGEHFQHDARFRPPRPQLHPPPAQ